MERNNEGRSIAVSYRPPAPVFAETGEGLDKLRKWLDEKIGQKFERRMTGGMARLRMLGAPHGSTGPREMAWR